MTSDKNGGAGTQTATKEPWLMAQPWLLSNMTQGQALQDRYTAQPFSPRQQAAYDNSYALTDYGRDLVPSLLGQIQGQQVGFDKSNPTAKPKAWDWNAIGSGLLGQKSVANASAAPAPAPAPVKSDFVNLDVTNPTNAYYGQLLSQNGVGVDLGQGGTPTGWNADFMRSANGAGYGTFKYGQAVPMPGTQAYRDMQEYLAYGGADPYNLYGKRSPWGRDSTNSGDSVGGSPAADGSGGGNAGVF